MNHNKDITGEGNSVKKKLKLLFFTHHGADAARSGAIAHALAENGHEITFVHTAPTARLRTTVTESGGIRWVSVPDLLWGRARTGWDLWSTFRRKAYLKQDNGPYDLIHCFETRPATIHPALYYQRRHNVPMITDWNDWWGRGGIIDHFRPKWYRMLFGRLETYYEEAFRKQAAGLTVIATALGQRAQALGVPADNICHIQGGTFPDFFLDRSKEECRKRCGLPLEHPVLGFSSLNLHWDLDVVIKTIAIVAKKYPSIKLILTGQTNNRVHELARSHGVENHLFVTGFLPKEDLPWYLGCADLFVLPFPDTLYNLGRWPNKLGDYLSLGRPTVANPIGDVKTFFDKHDVGLLADWDPVDFADKVMQLLDDSELSQRLGKNARQAALQYDYPTLIEKLEDFYLRILDTECGVDRTREADLPVICGASD